MVQRFLIIESFITCKEVMLIKTILESATTFIYLITELMWISQPDIELLRDAQGADCVVR